MTWRQVSRCLQSRAAIEATNHWIHVKCKSRLPLCQQTTERLERWYSTRTCSTGQSPFLELYPRVSSLRDLQKQLWALG
jgi:hypothetical protein